MFITNDERISREVKKNDPKSKPLKKKRRGPKKTEGHKNLLSKA